MGEALSIRLLGPVEPKTLSWNDVWNIPAKLAGRIRNSTSMPASTTLKTSRLIGHALNQIEMISA